MSVPNVNKKASWKDKMKALKVNEVYTRPWQLPVGIAMEITRIERVDNKSKPGTQSNRAIVKHSVGLALMVYLGNKFEDFTGDDLKEMCDEINKGNKLYLVSRGGVSVDKIVLDLIDVNELQESRTTIFDSNLHKIVPADKFGNPSTDVTLSIPECSPAKRFKSDPF